jgi:hypothetical protein
MVAFREIDDLDLEDGKRCPVEWIVPIGGKNVRGQNPSGVGSFAIWGENCYARDVFMVEYGAAFPFYYLT